MLRWFFIARSIIQLPKVNGCISNSRKWVYPIWWGSSCFCLLFLCGFCFFILLHIRIIFIINPFSCIYFAYFPLIIASWKTIMQTLNQRSWVPFLEPAHVRVKEENLLHKVILWLLLAFFFIHTHTSSEPIHTTVL